MPCSGQSIDNTGAETHKATTGDASETKKPTDIYYRPLYTIPGYKETLKEWTDTFDTAKIETVQISLDQGSNSSDDNSWSKTIAGEASASDVPFFAIKVNDESKGNEKTYELAKESSQVTLAVTLKNRQLFTIGAGDW